jgi:hypothetical protein
VLHLGASRKESFETLVDVVDVPVADRPRHALAMIVGVPTRLLPLDTEPNVVGLVHGGRDSQECPVQLLRSGEILDRIDDRSETLTS